MFIRTLQQDLELALAPGLKPEPVPAGTVIQLAKPVMERLVASRVAEWVTPEQARAHVPEAAAARKRKG